MLSQLPDIRGCYLIFLKATAKWKNRVKHTRKLAFTQEASIEYCLAEPTFWLSAGVKNNRKERLGPSQEFVSDLRPLIWHQTDHVFHVFLLTTLHRRWWPENLFVLILTLGGGEKESAENLYTQASRHVCLRPQCILHLWPENHNDSNKAQAKTLVWNEVVLGP